MNNLDDTEEPASYFKRVYKLKILEASKNEHAYMRLLECGGTISMDEWMSLVGKNKPE